MAANRTDTTRAVILANETIGDESLVREVMRHAEGRPTEVMIVAPALVKSPLDLAAGDVDDDIEQARRRLDESIAALERQGVTATGRVGEADPVLALEDAMRLFPGDEVIVVVNPPERRTWLEEDVVDKAREAVRVPVSVIEVDPDAADRREEERRIDREADQTFPASDPPANY